MKDVAGKLEAVLFDLDGTLLDTAADLTAAVNYTLAELGFPPVGQRAVVASTGNGALNLLRATVPGLQADTPDEDPLLARAASIYIPYYRDHSLVLTAPYAGVAALLESLSRAGLRLAVISNKPDSAAKIVVRHFFGETVRVVIGVVPGVPIKPAPHAVFSALAELGCAPSRAVYIGDSDVDLATARNAGLPALLVDWGFRTRAQLVAAGADPARIFSDAQALQDCILKL